MGLYLRKGANQATSKITNQGSLYIPPPTNPLAASGAAGAIDVSWTKGNATVTTEVMAIPSSSVALSDLFRSSPDGQDPPAHGVTLNGTNFPENGADVVIVTNAANDETKTVTGLVSGEDYAIAVRSIASATEANTTGDVGRAGAWVWVATGTAAG
jgi:hypothetical protein